MRLSDELNDRLDQEMTANKTLVAAKEDLEQLLRAAQQNNFDCADISVKLLTGLFICHCYR